MLQYVAYWHNSRILLLGQSSTGNCPGASNSNPWGPVAIAIHHYCQIIVSRLSFSVATAVLQTDQNLQSAQH